MGSKIRIAILKTILYSDIFDYPLRKEEMWRFLIAEKQITIKALVKELSEMKNLSEKDGLYYIKGRKNIVLKRIARSKISLEKQKIAEKAAGLLSKIPTLECVFLSGGLAMENVEINDDIDFFIITSENSLWITRFLSLLVLELFGFRRRRGERKVFNKICLNLFLSKKNLLFPKYFQNLYTAHEISQAKLIFQRNNTQELFLSSNRWINTYLPNFPIPKIENKTINYNESILIKIIEKIVRRVQLVYMSSHRTTEYITDTILAFHPRDYKNFVLKEYNKRLRKFNLS